MPKLPFVLLLSFVTNLSFCQLIGAGLQLKVQRSNQFYSFPDRPDNGVSLRQGLTSPGIDIFGEFRITDRINFIAKLGIETKGYTSLSFATYDVIDGNKFHYGALDLNIKYHFTKKGLLRPFMYSGISYGNMFKMNLESAEYSEEVLGTTPWGTELVLGDMFDSKEYDYTEYSLINFGFVLGFGVTFKDLIWLEFEWNRDLISPLNTDDVNLKNRAYSVNLGINLFQGTSNIIEKRRI